MSETAVKNRDLVVSKIKEPGKHKVIFFNDDVTPMEFVIALLMSLFKHSEASAINVTMQVHNEGAGVAGIYTFEIAEQKAIDATAVAKSSGYPLVIKVEEE